jgi:hypothetical protein
MGHRRRAAAFAAKNEGQQVLVGSAARTSNGDYRFSGMGFAAIPLKLELTVSAVSGTSPNLAVVVEGSVDGGNTWNNKVSFAAKTAPGTEVVTVPLPLEDHLRIRWTITGTSPSFTFQVVNRLDLRAYKNVRTSLRFCGLTYRQ